MKLEEWVKEALDEKGKRTDPLHLAGICLNTPASAARRKTPPGWG